MPITGTPWDVPVPRKMKEKDMLKDSFCRMFPYPLK